MPDLIESMSDTFLGPLGLTSGNARQLAGFLSGGTGGVLTAHSQGAILVRNAFRSLDTQTFAPGWVVQVNGSGTNNYLLQRAATSLGASWRPAGYNQGDAVHLFAGMNARSVRDVGIGLFNVHNLFRGPEHSPHSYVRSAEQECGP